MHNDGSRQSLNLHPHKTFRTTRWNASTVGCMSAHGATLPSGRVALTISGMVRTSALTAARLRTFVLADDPNLDVFYCLAAVRASELDRTSISYLRAISQVRGVSVEWVTGTNSSFRQQWSRVACAYQLAMAHARKWHVSYSAVVRLRSDTRFDCRYDFRAMATTFSGHAGAGVEWLALPHTRRFDARGCSAPLRWRAMWTCCVDAVAIGTVRAMLDYTTFTPANVDNLPIFTEDYVLYSAFRRFRFDGSAASGIGPYGTAVSGDFTHNRSGGPCFLGTGSVPPYPKWIVSRHASNPHLTPTVCRDTAAAKLFMFDSRGIQPAMRFHPFSTSRNRCAGPSECIDKFYLAKNSALDGRCPPNVRAVGNHTCMAAGDRQPVACKRLGCFAHAPVIPPVPPYIRLMYTDRRVFELEAALHRVDPKFIIHNRHETRLPPTPRGP